ncbi:hypothetical protein ABZ434_25915 [Streptomyces sp. NPDC005761]|uniref:hypothetical protein n=1 Tax=unclassified Streptomyces TaxID=2593676 RepID=UPI00340F62B0
MDTSDLLNPDLVRAFADDFTEADLSDTDLRTVPLDGLRWSALTRWPSYVDPRVIRARSVQTGPDSGVFVITYPGLTADHLPLRI